MYTPAGTISRMLLRQSGRGPQQAEGALPSRALGSFPSLTGDIRERLWFLPASTRENERARASGLLTAALARDFTSIGYRCDDGEDNLTFQF